MITYIKNWMGRLEEKSKENFRKQMLEVTADSKICRHCGEVYPLDKLPPTKEAHEMVYFDCLKCNGLVCIPETAIKRAG